MELFQALVTSVCPGCSSCVQVRQHRPRPAPLPGQAQRDPRARPRHRLHRPPGAGWWPAPVSSTAVLQVHSASSYSATRRNSVSVTSMSSASLASSSTRQRHYSASVGTPAASRGLPFYWPPQPRARAGSRAAQLREQSETREAFSWSARTQQLSTGLMLVTSLCNIPWNRK